MGGINSGRQNGKPTVEGSAALILDINHLVRVAAKKSTTLKVLGALASRPYEIWLNLEMPIWPAGGRILIQHDAIEHLTATLPSVSYSVQIEATPCRLGGEQCWFVCPATGGRVKRLFLPNGADRFLSRQAHGLYYRSQRQTPEALAWARAHRAQLALDARGAGNGFRPAGMHRATYDRLTSRLVIAEARAIRRTLQWSMDVDGGPQ